jgi:integrase
MGSVFQLSKLMRKESGAWRGRKAIPQTVRIDYQRLYGPGCEAIFWRPACTTAQQAKAEFAEWLALIERRITALQEASCGRAIDLTQQQADALAGDWYRWYTAQYLANPGSPDGYDIVRGDLWSMAVDAGDPETGEADFDDPEVLNEVETLARASQFLTDRGRALTQAGRTRFLASLVREFLAATALLERRARGDWGPDKHLDQLAPILNLCPAATSSSSNVRTEMVFGRPVAAAAVTATELFEAYVKDTQRKPRTVERWRCVFTALDAENWRAPGWDAQQWLDGLVAANRSPRTVSDTWLSAARAVFNWAIRKRRKDASGHRLVEVNPFDGCSVTVPKKPITRETEKAFADNEIQTILSAALKVEVPPLGGKGWQWAACRQWVPWLLAYTGARVGELTQLRAQDIERRACGPVLLITPDAGTVKTDEARTVPLHSHLVELGLLDYVAAVAARFGKQARLFYKPPPQPSRSARYRGPAVKAGENLAAWVRGLGVTDPDIRPNHAWRHTFLTLAARVGIEKRIRIEICGHAPETVADKYEHPTVEDMAAALKRFPRYKVK